MAEISRLDGDGLLVRRNKALSWASIAGQLRVELDKAQTPEEIGRIFARVDAAYPNLHAHINLSPKYDYRGKTRVGLPISVYPEEIKEDGSIPTFRIGGARKEFFSTDLRPKSGDVLLSINGRTIQEWAKENIEFCKYPLASQCHIEFFRNFKMELLSWNRSQKLSIDVLRKGETLSFSVPITLDEVSKAPHDNTQTCRVENERYLNFQLAYEGRNLCAYESKNHPAVAVLRLNSFNYRKDNHPIQSISEDAREFEQKYWLRNKSRLKTVVIDLIDNYGGDKSLAWLSTFLAEPYQEQWVEIKNIKELQSPDWRKISFYGEAAKEKHFHRFASAEFLPPIPQFCPPIGNCSEHLWPVREKPFMGQYIFLLNHDCISSCVGFAWTMKNYLKERLFVAGIPDSGDSTYARAYIQGALLDKAPFYQVTTTPQAHGSHARANFSGVFQQAVSISMSTNARGEIISGRPLSVNLFLAPTWQQTPDEWVSSLLEKVLVSVPR